MRKEKNDKVLYEKRVCEKACWACVTMQEDTYEQSVCAGFMKLMKYICHQNTTGNYLGMTVPIVTVVRTDDTRTTLSRDVTVAYHLPSQHQHSSLPMPFDPDITVETWPATVLYSRTFSGPTNETTILEEVHAFVEQLDSLDLCLNNAFIIAGYSSLAATHRHNEIWFLERQIVRGMSLPNQIILDVVSVLVWM
ncbi:heme-binding protein 1-like [Aplochiton taeniatus]